MEETLRHKSVDMADPKVVRDYAIDLRNLLTKSSITEQRSFLKSFVERIDVDNMELKVYYTIPMPPYNVAEETVGVLPFIHLGQRRGGDFLKEGLRPFKLSRINDLNALITPWCWGAHQQCAHQF